MGSQDTEITLGTGKMLALFFSLVALCGLFFGLGFSLGRGSVRPLSGPEQAQAPVGPALRNSAIKSSSGAAPQATEGMTLYKNGEQKTGNPPVPQADAAPKQASSKESGTQNGSALPDPMAATAGPGYFVQVAAVSKQDDSPRTRRRSTNSSTSRLGLSETSKRPKLQKPSSLATATIRF